MIKIKLYQNANQNGINQLMNEIASEFDLPISSQRASSVNKTVDKYWVAFNGSEIIGTVAVLEIENKDAVLKRMFVKKNHRGEKFGVSYKLLQKAFDWCTMNNMNCIYLGTMGQFKAAHRFYEKNGFQKIAQNELPSNFIKNPVDDVFYKKVARG
jgi:GNAT superfamily N-acetyltransferase